ncbi:uncharacterized protein LOC111311658 isoform X2 [Durio zibethinus]|uniref:Uncharacterized protein LOC111311658 isoform X2 n=1 Tax=Durio zibethinus TaxID=66656 RepID=A0A6P6AQ17_DURZI|nr:uncharacterized protein LOC111311658 isoform X2 [Durio zibethinus]
MMQTVRGGRVFCSKYAATPATLVAEARNIVRRGRSYAASLPSGTPQRKRVSKDERRALIESFVTSYQNISGKVVNKEDKSFAVVEVVSTAVGVQDDTCTEATDDVKMLETNNNQLEADRVLQGYTLAGETFSEVVLMPQTPGSHCEFVLEENNMLKDDAKSLEKQEDDKLEDSGIASSDKFLMFVDEQKIVEASDQHIESEECKIESQGVPSDFGVVEGDLLREETEMGNTEDDEKEQTVSKELLNSGSPELEAEHQQQFPEEEKYARNLSSVQSDDGESSKKSTLWGNLKSFADGIINIWRKL